MTRTLVGPLLAVLLALPSSHALAQGAHPANTRRQDATAILNYIHASWNSLSRSTDECASLVDPKLNTAPVLYLPAGMAPSASVLSAEEKCHVRVHDLPRTIRAIGDVQPAELPAEGLLYLPHRYVVPGGRFNEMYGWDSYFIILGLVQDNRDDLARGMVENFFFEIDHYGALLNANRTYYLTRSQPPLLSSMIREVYEHHGTAPALTKTWLAHAYEMAVRDHALWTSDVHRIGTTGLARYHDLGAGPVPEMADDSDYYRNVIRWLLAHPSEQHGYLLAAPDQPDAAQVTTLAQTSCDIRVSHVCAQAVVDAHRLTAGFYRGDRAMRESGFDTSFRFGPFSGSTEDYAGNPLNVVTSTSPTGLTGVVHPNLLGAVPYLKARTSRTAVQWFPNAVCTSPAAPAGCLFQVLTGYGANGLGNLRRNALNGPDFSDLDVSLEKDTQIHENLTFNLRVDAFDVPNHPNFSNPGLTATANSATFGTITATRAATGDQGSSRQLQIAAKIVF